MTNEQLATFLAAQARFMAAAQAMPGLDKAANDTAAVKLAAATYMGNGLAQDLQNLRNQAQAKLDSATVAAQAAFDAATAGHAELEASRAALVEATKAIGVMVGV